MLRQFGGIALARGLNSAAQALLLIFMARALGARDFGVFASIASVQAFLLTVGGLNIPTYISREFSLRNYSKTISALHLNSISLAVFSLIALIVSVRVSNSITILAIASGNLASLFLEGQNECRFSLSFAQKSIARPFQILTVRAVATVTIYGLFWVANQSPALCYMGGRAGASILTATMTVITIPLPKREELTRVPIARTLRELLPMSWTLAMNSARTLDNAIVALVAGPTASGIYAAASKLTMPFAIASSALCSIIMPRIAVGSRAYARRAMDALALISLVISVSMLALIPFADSIMTLLFGPDFVNGGAVLSWVLLRVGPVIAIPAMSSVLQARNLDRLAALIASLISVLTFAFLFALGSTLGEVGAASGYFAASALGVGVLWITGSSKID